MAINAPVPDPDGYDSKSLLADQLDAGTDWLVLGNMPLRFMKLRLKQLVPSWLLPCPQ